MRSKERGRERVGPDVVSKNFDIRGVYLAQEPHLEIGGRHVSGRANPLGHPPSDRPSPPTDLQTPSAPAYPEALDAPLREWVEMLLQQLKTARVVLGRMRERIIRCLAHSQDRKSPHS